MFQSTRRRLAIWYAAMTAVLLLLFATGFYLYVRNALIERIDDTLEHVVEVVERSLVIETIPETIDSASPRLQVKLEASFRHNPKSPEDDHIDLEWFSPTGELLWSTFNEPLMVPLHANRPGETVHINGDYTLRQVTRRVVDYATDSGRQVLGYLRVSHPWFEVTKPTQQLILDLSFGSGLMAVAVGAIGWFLSGLAMAPVRESYHRLKQFTADASHELRSPLATIQTQVQVALADKDLKSDSPTRGQLEVIERLTRRMGRLVDDLLFLARRDSGIVQPVFSLVHLDEVLLEVVEEMELTAAANSGSEGGISLSLHIADTAVSCPYGVRGDRQQLARLFANLISNAMHFSPPGGTVRVELSSLFDGEMGSRGAGGQGSRGGSIPELPLQVKVIDSGIGIPPESLPHIFDRFYRVSSAREWGGRQYSSGSGLGLAIARSIVETHQGSIRVESIVDMGTTFTVTIPAATEEMG
ncbi:cell wall metabolism sensor histidine kinase WalK [[Phormidium] sp. ETS-05]|uniref:sensor histidine kinase n=1 Tax=[Phormidium] sp. ETS-05 TaxID=222819 RepID=UPI0018EF2608|nr:HAMP domain-containing sensor histidine kinase [[Phormidium] sp. ETS-05]